MQVAKKLLRVFFSSVAFCRWIAAMPTKPLKLFARGQNSFSAQASARQVRVRASGFCAVAATLFSV